MADIIPAIVVRDARQPVTSTIDNIPIGAVVSYPTDADPNVVRRGVVTSRARGALHILDGENTVVVRGERRERVVMLAKSTDDYTQRVSRTASTLRARQNWCSVPNELVRKLNNTPAVGAPGALHVVVNAVQRHVVQPTDMTLRRKTELQRILERAYVVQSPGWFNDRDLSPLQDATVDHILTLVDPPAPA